MPIINFSVPKTLDRRVAKTIAAKGFASKAEFFRFAAICFMDNENRTFANEDERFDYLTKEIEKKIIERYGGKKLPSARAQLAGLD